MTETMTGDICLSAFTLAASAVAEAMSKSKKPRRQVIDATPLDPKAHAHKNTGQSAGPDLPELVSMADVRTDGGTQARVTIDETVVKDYADALEEGAKLPPVVLYYDESAGVYWLADGFHRFEAHRVIGRVAISAFIKDGTLRDAKLHAAGANATHGLRRTNADKRNAVTMLLEDPELVQWSDREIAKACDVSHMLVASVRREHLEEMPDSPAAPASRTVTRNGTTYQQKVKDKPSPAPVSMNSVAESSDECNAKPPVVSVPTQDSELEKLRSDGEQHAVSNVGRPESMSDADLGSSEPVSELLANAQGEIKRLAAQVEALQGKHKAEMQREIATRVELQQRLDEALEREVQRDERLDFLGGKFVELGNLLGVVGAKNIVDRVRVLVAMTASLAPEADLAEQNMKRSE